jgi:hypothetical protein
MNGRERRRDYYEVALTWSVRLLWWVAVPLACVLIVYYAVQDIGPAYEARFGTEGVEGTFVVQREECDRSCVQYGTFTADDGSVLRTDVLIGSGAGGPAIGETIRAKDTGDRAVVYPLDGGWDWLFTTLLTLGALAGITIWARALWSALSNRR